MDAAKIHEIELQARARFTYFPDPVDRDYWRSHGDEVLANKDWKDDCDGLASTILDLLGRAGMPLEDRYRLLVDSDHDGKPDHMIGACVDDAGDVWIVGDTFNHAPYHAASMLHGPYEYNRLSEAGAKPVWRGGVPWSEK